MDLHLHDKVELKKAHPCGSTQWEILRVGMDIKLKCLGCGHDHSISMPPEPQHLCCGPNRLPGGRTFLQGASPFCDRISLRSAL